jgi:hypothetical protein
VCERPVHHLWPRGCARLVTCETPHLSLHLVRVSLRLVTCERWQSSAAIAVRKSHEYHRLA